MFNLNMDVVDNAVRLMWQGMLGIFVVLGVLALVVFVFTKIKFKDENAE